MAKKKKAKKRAACSQVISRNKKGQYPKGVSGNPSGKRIHSWRNELEDAIRIVEKKKRKKFMVYAVEKAYTDNHVLVAVLKKLLPDLKTEEIDAGANLKTFIDWLVSRDADS